MNSIANLQRWLALGCALVCTMVLGLALASCEPPPPRVPSAMTVGITGYNFTSEGVQEFYVNGKYASNLPPYGGGGGTSCCVALPGRWTPELTVKVDWTIGDYTLPWSKLAPMTPEQRSSCCWRQRTLSKTVHVERYGDEGGLVEVFFLPNDEIKVWVYDAGPQNPNHPSHMGYPKKPTSAE